MRLSLIPLAALLAGVFTFSAHAELAWQQGSSPTTKRASIAPARHVAASNPLKGRDANPAPAPQINTPAPTQRIAKQPTRPVAPAKPQAAVNNRVQPALATSPAGTPAIQQGQVVYASAAQAGAAMARQGSAMPSGVVQAGCNCQQGGAPMMADPYGDGVAMGNGEMMGGCAGGACGCGDPMCADASCGVPTCGDVGCGDMCGPDGCCGACGCGVGEACLGGCAERGAIPLVLYVPPIKELTLFGGVQGFKGPLDFRPNNRDGGNFGIHEGINIGGKMAWLPFPYLGYQIGYQATHSQLDGDGDRNTTDSLTQHFATAGLFHRRRVGLQYGVVWDHLRNERQMPTSFGQVRGLIGITNPMGREVGFTFTAHTNAERIGAVNYQAVDQYLFYYAIHGKQGGVARLLGGFTDDSDGIFGADVLVPLSDSFSLETGFTYLMPGSETGVELATQEQWNLGMNLVWHFGRRAKSCQTSPFRPMFNLADNGSMLVDDR